MEYSIEIDTKFRGGAGEYVVTVVVKADGYLGTHKYTGKTGGEARNAAFAAIGYILLSIS